MFIEFALAASITTAAQDAPLAERLPQFPGQWQGTGWIMTPQGERETFDIYESIKAGSGGHALIIRSEGFSPEGSGRDGELTHDASAIMFVDNDGSVKLRSVVGTGQTIEADVTFHESGYDWSIDMGPRGHVEYTAEVGDESWTETGQFCPPQGDCIPTFYMTLEKTED